MVSASPAPRTSMWTWLRRRGEEYGGLPCGIAPADYHDVRAGGELSLHRSRAVIDARAFEGCARLVEWRVCDTPRRWR